MYVHVHAHVFVHVYVYVFMYTMCNYRYVDFPVTDVLQMMGRAGRPQFDQQGVAVILVRQRQTIVAID